MATGISAGGSEAAAVTFADTAAGADFAVVVGTGIVAAGTGGSEAALAGTVVAAGETVDSFVV